MNDIKPLFSSVSDIITAKKCFMCGEGLPQTNESEMFCGECHDKYERLFEMRCQNCGFEPELCRCAPGTLISNRIRITVLHLFAYRFSNIFARRVIYALKRRRTDVLITYFANIAAKRIGDEINNRIYGVKHGDISDCVFTYVPRSEKNIRKFGFDQSRMLCCEICSILGTECTALFSHRDTANDQKVLKNGERIGNARRSYKYIYDGTLKDKTVVIVDDVITSGNTVKTCVNLAKSKGARDFIVFSVAQTGFHRKRRNEYEQSTK